MLTTNPPLAPNASQETGGALATVATQSSLSANASGTPADAAYSGSGSTTIISALKGIYAAIKGVLVHDDVALASIVDSTTTAGYVYFPEAAPGTAVATAAWRISRLNTATGQTTWLNGNANYTNTAVPATYSVGTYS